jgi:branched-chain amino acid transport system substrate-binding protein
MKKILCIIAAFTVLACLLIGCTTPPPAPGPTNTTPGTTAAAAFKIGGTGPLTGGAAIYGIAVKQGAELAVTEINALGGIQFDFNFQDDEHDAEKAVNAYNKLKDWNMQVSLSSVTSTPGVATSAEAYVDRMFGLTPSASSTAVTEDNDNIYQLCFADPNQGSATAQYIYDKKLGNNIAVIYKNDDVYSKGIYETFDLKARELGLNIVSATTFTEDSQTDFSVQIADAQSKGADFIFLPMYYTPASLIFKQASSIGYAPRFFGVDGMDGILTLDGFDTALAEGVMLLTPFSADAKDELTQNFVASYQAKYGEIPNQFAADGYDCVYAIYKAITESGGGITSDMSAKEICEKLIAIFNGGFVFDGVTGSGMTWNPQGQVTKEPKAVIIENGVYVGME